MNAPTPQTPEPAARSVSRVRPPAYLLWLVGLGLALGLWLRLLGLTLPPYDHHHFRQCQTLSTIEAFYADGIDLFHARALYMGYPGVFVLEFPLFQAVVASLYHVFGPHWAVVRCLNIFFGAGSTWLLYLITARYLGRVNGLFAALIFWLAPLNILYHRSMLIDPMAVACGLLSFYALARVLDGDENPTSAWPGRWFWLFSVATLVTALIKALYLWPSVLLFGFGFWGKRFRLDRSLLGIGASFGLAGVCFVAWNMYAARTNAASVITRGVTPTTLLGVSFLFKPDFYHIMLVSRPKWWLGLVAATLYTVGIWACFSPGRVDQPLLPSDQRMRNPLISRARMLWLFLLIPPTYLMAFANINYPHEYYQLVITPFLAILAAYGLTWLAARFANQAPVQTLSGSVLVSASGILFASAFLTYVVWFKMPLIDPHAVEFEKLSAGHFEPWAPAMLFGSPEATGMLTGSAIPAFLYAGKLWGYCLVVPDAAAAKPAFEEESPGFQRLDYLVFFGTARPDWVPEDRFRLGFQDQLHHFFVFRRIGL